MPTVTASAARVEPTSADRLADGRLVPDSSRVALEDFAAAWQDRYPLRSLSVRQPQHLRRRHALQRAERPVPGWDCAVGESSCLAHHRRAAGSGRTVTVALLRRCPPALANASAGRLVPSSCCSSDCILQLADGTWILFQPMPVCTFLRLVYGNRRISQLASGRHGKSPAT